MISRGHILSAILLTALGSRTGSSSSDDGARPPAQGPLLPDEDKARDYFTDTTLLTQEGKEVRFYTDVLKDHVVIINGFYTRCEGLSPGQAQVLADLEEMLADRLGKEVFIVSITVDPAYDSVEKVSDYARKWSAGPGRLFLTGKPEDVDRVNHKLGQFHESPEDHAGIYLMGNVRTGLWMKLPLHAMSRDLYLQLQRLLQDEGEPPGEEP